MWWVFISQDPRHQRSQMVSAVLALTPYTGIALASAALVVPHSPLNTGRCSPYRRLNTRWIHDIFFRYLLINQLSTSCHFFAGTSHQQNLLSRHRWHNREKYCSAILQSNCSLLSLFLCLRQSPRSMQETKPIKINYFRINQCLWWNDNKIIIFAELK